MKWIMSGVIFRRVYYFEKELKKANKIVLVGYTEQFDAAELKRIGKLKTAQVGSTWSNPVI